MSTLYLWIDEKPEGPFAPDQITTMLREDKISTQTLCCRDGDPSWKTISEHDLQDPEESEAEPTESPLPSTPQSESDRIREHATSVMAVSYLLFFLMGCALFSWFFSQFVAMRDASITPLITAASCFSIGISLVIIAQVMHIRALVAHRCGF